LCYGKWGWSQAFAARGHKCVGVDLVRSEPPENCQELCLDLLDLTPAFVRDGGFDFGVASTPCEEFSVWGMKHFHPNPRYPAMGIRLFNHARWLFEESGLPYVMENVRPAQQFVGRAIHRCGPFCLWGNAVPPLMPQGITKGIDVGSSKLVKGMTREEKREYRKQFPWNQAWSTSKRRQRDTAKAATIPPELSNTVADYAERLLTLRAQAEGAVAAER
jgi:hypothetical protein